MRNTLKTAAVIALALVVAFALVGCGGSSPESLAKQYASLAKDAMKAIADGDMKKLEQLEKKGEAIEKKVEALSERDQEKFYDLLSDMDIF